MENKNYGKSFYKKETEYAKNAADNMMDYLLSIVRAKSLVDFGCGTGAFLLSAKKHGVSRVVGLDGEYAHEFFDEESGDFISCDLSENIDLHEKFDLLICLEVAEHIHPCKAEMFINNLVRHSDIILFGAAIKFQGGNTHLNEQMPSYWRKLFTDRGFAQIDCIRPVFWTDSTIPFFYRQNSFLYVKEDKADAIRALVPSCWKGEDMVHPDMWELAHKKMYLFPFKKIDPMSKLVIYGSGAAGKAYVQQINKTGYATIVLWVDAAYKQYKNTDMNIMPPERILDYNYDRIIIAVEKASIADEIETYLVGLGIDKSKMYWEIPFYDAYEG